MAPPFIVKAGLPTNALVAHVVVSKFSDHTPLHRHEQILQRQGLHIDRSTLADWVGHAAWHVRPLHAHLMAELKSSVRLFADEMRLPVLAPGTGKTTTGQLWTYARDDGPGAAPRRQRSPISTSPTGRAAGRLSISPALPDSSRSTAMPATIRWAPAMQ